MIQHFTIQRYSAFHRLSTDQLAELANLTSDFLLTTEYMHCYCWAALECAQLRKVNKLEMPLKQNHTVKLV